MRATLERRAATVTVDAWARLDFLVSRPELGHLCRSADGALDAEAVRAALPGLSARAARRVLDRCRVLGLVDSHGSLTSLGREAAETDRVPAPEQGVYRIAFVDEPPLRRCILHVERLRPDEARAAGEGDRDLAERFRPETQGPFPSVAQQGRSVVFRDWKPNTVHKSDQGEVRFRVHADFDADTVDLQVYGRLAMNGLSRDCADPGRRVELDLDAVRRDWAGRVLPGRWRDGRLAVSWAAVERGDWGGSARDGFTGRRAGGQAPLFAGMDWVLVTVDDVPLAPESAGDALAWARARFLATVAEQAWLPWPEVAARHAELVAGSPLEPFAPPPPSFAELVDALQAAEGGPPWKLLAAVDLAPRPWTPEELAGEASVVVAPDRLQFRYGERRSLRELVEALFGPALRFAEDGGARLLVVDRYVRGHDNLANFEALLRCLPEGARVDVVTDPEDDRARLEALLGGGRWWSYRSFFGRDRRQQPHDRYLVLDADGEVVAWQLSNPILDGRPVAGEPAADPDRELVWRDLMALRLEPEELPPAVRRWLNGGAR